MTQTIETTVAIEAVETAAVAAAPAVVEKAPKAEKAPKEPKAPSKKSQAVAIFAAKMEERRQGLFKSNKEFRAAVLRAIESELGVSTPSAATMYNSCKDEAEKADPAVGLGRDPKIVKIKTEGGKRGRPAKAKATVVITDATVESTEEAVAA